MTDSPHTASHTPASATGDAASDPSAGPPPDLLDFTPVVRKVKRPDGWTDELQLEFIRRLAVNGSPQQTCTEMGKHVTGIEALYKVPAADSFRAAWDEALRIGRTAMGLDCGPPHLGPVPGIQRRPPRGAAPPVADEWDDDDESAMSDEDQRALFENIFRKFVLKVGKEREARLAGRIVEADFTLRQVTCIEIALDLMAEGFGMSGFEAIQRVRRGGLNIFAIAETPMSRALDEARRAAWAEAGDPERPEHPPKRFLVEHDGYTTEPTDPLPGGTDDECEAETAAQDRQYAEDAAAQVEWESSARRAHEERRASDASS